ncbi:hypothetical protein ABK040_002726 [Willaertia magna]
MLLLETTDLTCYLLSFLTFIERLKVHSVSKDLKKACIETDRRYVNKLFIRNHLLFVKKKNEQHEVEVEELPPKLTIIQNHSCRRYDVTLHIRIPIYCNDSKATLCRDYEREREIGKRITEIVSRLDCLRKLRYLTYIRNEQKMTSPLSFEEKVPNMFTLPFIISNLSLNSRLYSIRIVINQDQYIAHWRIIKPCIEKFINCNNIGTINALKHVKKLRFDNKIPRVESKDCFNFLESLIFNFPTLENFKVTPRITVQEMEDMVKKSNEKQLITTFGQSIKRLSGLNLHEYRVLDKSLALFFNRFKNLTYLSLNNFPELVDTTFSFPPSITKLTLNSCPHLKDSDFVFLFKNLTLKKLVLLNCTSKYFKGEGFLHVRRDSLKSLLVSKHRCEDKKPFFTMKYISRFTQLEKLFLDDLLVDSFEPIRKLTQLRILLMCSLKLIAKEREKELNHLTNLRRLRRVEISLCDILVEEIVSLSELWNINCENKELEISCVVDKERNNVEDYRMTAIKYSSGVSTRITYC